MDKRHSSEARVRAATEGAPCYQSHFVSFKTRRAGKETVGALAPRRTPAWSVIQTLGDADRIETQGHPRLQRELQASLGYMTL